MLKRIRILFGLDANESASASEPATDAINTKPTPVDVTDADFEHVVLASERLAVVDFWADWCQPCKIVSMHMYLLAQEYGQTILAAALDVEENVETAARYGIQGLPTVIFFWNGAEVHRQAGAGDYEAFRAKVQQLLSAL